MILGPHKGILKDLIWKYKYKFISDMSIPLSELTITRYGEFLREKRFLVTYSPISKERLNWRGFNQAELLAKNVSTGLGLTCTNLLYKENNTIAQVGHSRRERIANVKDKIKYIGGSEVANRKVLIIDDVYTTGATLDECAKVLRKAGYREVWGLVLSRD
jgi:ComF family protein